MIPMSPVTPSLNSSPEKGLIFELWLRDSHFNFHLKIAMLFILIYIFFIFSSFFRFFICDYVIPVSPMTPNSNSILFFIFSLFFRFFICDYVIPVSPVTPNLNFSSKKGPDIWAVIAWFPFQFPLENCHVIYFDLYLLYIFIFF